MTLLVCVCLLLAMMVFPVRAEEAATAELFVDAVQGNDTNDGLSKETPLATLSAAFHKLVELDEETPAILNLARGSVWRESYTPKHFTKEQQEFLGARTRFVEGDEFSDPPEDLANPELRRWPPYHFSRDHLTIRAYGEGEPPTIDGTEDLPNKNFVRHDPENYPHVWSQEVVPPLTHWVFAHGRPTVRPAVIVDDERMLTRVYLPLAFNVRDYADSLEGIETEADALEWVNANPGSFFPRDNGDGSYTYFVNTGGDPTSDGHRYTYKARGSQFRGNNINWENIRFHGLNHRDGLGGGIVSMRGVEIRLGDVHNMLISRGHFEDVVSTGFRPVLPEGTHHSFGSGYTHSLFHTHGVNSPGIVYDRCIARDGNIAFYDHHADANREAVVIRDCVTEDIRTVFAHGNSTKRGYLIGHRHRGREGDAFSGLGGMTSGENFIEDSIFRFDQAGRGQWHKSYGGHLRMRNSVLHAGNGAGSSRVIFNPQPGSDWEYENATLILDLSKMENPNGSLALAPLKEGSEDRTRWVLRNCVVAILGAEGVIATGPDSEGVIMHLAGLESVDLVLDNCVLTYIGSIPESAGEEGKDYVFATVEEIFAGNPAAGDYSLNPDGPAAKRDAGYREGRKPVIRRVADQEAEKILARLQESK